MPLKPWIAAARLRTLPLALSTILLGTFMAARYAHFDGWVLLLCVLTATSYQVLSNYANDLGDGLRGTDKIRIGEARAVASGQISAQSMKGAVWLFALISLALGTYLSIYATQGLPWYITYGFVALGAMAVFAAINYTVGKNPYGYAGFGDVFVLIFFGWVGTMGSFFLQTGQLRFMEFLPATAIGFVAMGVLNLNNMRDAEQDKLSGKNTLALKLGPLGAKVYQTFLLLGALSLSLIYVFSIVGYGGLFFLGAAVIWVVNLIKTLKADHPSKLDKLLKPLAISALLYALLMGLGVHYHTVAMMAKFGG